MDLIRVSRLFSVKGLRKSICELDCPCFGLCCHTVSVSAASPGVCAALAGETTKQIEAKAGATCEQSRASPHRLAAVLRCCVLCAALVAGLPELPTRPSL